MSSLANELDNLLVLQNLCSQHAENGIIPELIQHNFVLTQQQLLPKLQSIFEQNQHLNPAFEALAANFPTEAIAISTWQQMQQASSNLILALNLAIPYVPIYEEDVKSTLYPAHEIIEVSVGKDLLKIIQLKELPKRLAALRSKLEELYGFSFPQVTFRDDSELEHHRYHISIMGHLSDGVALHNKLLAIATNDAFPKVTGVACTDPIFGLPAKWISSLLEGQAQKEHCIILSPLGVIIAHLERAIRQYYHRFLQSDSLSQLIQRSHDVASLYIALPKMVWMDIFQNCLRSQISLVDFEHMLNRILDLQQQAPEDLRQNADYLFVELRKYFPPPAIKKAMQSGKITVLQFTDDSFNYLLNELEIEAHNIYLPNIQELLQRLAQEYLTHKSHNPQIVCPDYLVPLLLKRLERQDLTLPLVMDSEIPDHIKREEIAQMAILTNFLPPQ